MRKKRRGRKANLAQSAGLTLGLEQAEDVVDLDCMPEERELVPVSIFHPLSFAQPPITSPCICLPGFRGNRVPGPLTLRMMLREVSSMNSTRTWVTPPREPRDEKNPRQQAIFIFYTRVRDCCGGLVSDQLPGRNGEKKRILGSGRNVPVRPSTRVTLTSLTGVLPESILQAGWSTAKERLRGQETSGTRRWPVLG